MTNVGRNCYKGPAVQKCFRDAADAIIGAVSGGAGHAVGSGAALDVTAASWLEPDGAFKLLRSAFGSF